MPAILRLLRPHQYAKNLLVFAAPGAAGRLDDADVVGQALLAFVLFCAVSSAGYVVNDLLDAEADRTHPVKRNRPIASGQVSPNLAMLVLAGLVVFSVGLALIVGWLFTAVLVGYGALSMIYSLRLKRFPWIELAAVSAGFVLRALAGGAATDTRISAWFLVVVSAGALLMITGKRVGELVALGSGTPSRPVLAGYQLMHLRILTVVAALLAVGGYAAWAAAEAANRVSGSTGALILRLTALPFAAAIARYLALAWQGAGETPESLLLRDRLLVLAGVLWMALYGAGLYL